MTCTPAGPSSGEIAVEGGGNYQPQNLSLLTYRNVNP